MSKEKMYAELISALKKKKLNKNQLAKLKNKLCSKYKIREMPTDIQILLHSKENLKLVSKPTRTLSGVAVVAVMSYPFKCPHGKCAMCPGGVGSVFGDVPQSYTGKEPATMRGIRNNFDAYMQVMNRLEHYVVMGHNPEKVELIIMGGTFPSFKKSYQEKFVTDCFKAMNDFSSMFYSKKGLDINKFKRFFELPGEVGDPVRTKKIHAKLKKLKKKSSLEKEQAKNEKSAIKCVGLTLETRPDYAKLKQGKEMLRLGCTRVELGIQSVYDKALKKIERGHTVKDSIESIKILKDLGFKINAHYMLGLPGIGAKKDINGLKELFSNEDFKPDMLKLYPCMVVKGTKLYRQWKAKKFKPINTSKAVSIIASAKKFIPSYVRIMRVQRDIPTYVTSAGVDRTNLRQYVAELAKQKGIKCKCIRCREVGRAKNVGKPMLKMKHYAASGGNEFFISAEDKNGNLFGFCRLRFPSEELVGEDSALIRELHVYGVATGVGKKGNIQHKGLGKGLLKAAEEISKDYYKKKMVVISGVGVRGYYKKFGYKKEGNYMVKKI